MSSPDSPLTMQSAISAYVAAQCNVILDSEPALKSHEDVVHPTRVAVRRLRSTLRSFDEMFDETEAGSLETELAWWARRLGAVRDLDVLQARLSAALAELGPELVMGPVASHLRSEIAARRKVGFDALLEALASERYRNLLEQLTRWRDDPPFVDLHDRPVAALKAIVKRTAKAQRKRLAAADGSETETAQVGELLHRARKAAKRHRYALELAEPVLGRKTSKKITAVKTVQDALGSHQDSLVSADFLRAVGAEVGSTPGHNGFTYGLLYAREIEFQRAFAARFTELMD